LAKKKSRNKNFAGEEAQKETANVSLLINKYYPPLPPSIIPPKLSFPLNQPPAKNSAHY